MLASRKKSTAWVSKYPSKTFFEKRIEKFPGSSRITAGLVLRSHSRVNLNVALGREGRKPS
jgi:hypothetical protein